MHVSSPQQQQSSSLGEFTTDCGVNANKLYNSDNINVAPGVDNGAHHTHDEQLMNTMVECINTGQECQ